MSNYTFNPLADNFDVNNPILNSDDIDDTINSNFGSNVNAPSGDVDASPSIGEQQTQPTAGGNATTTRTMPEGVRNDQPTAYVSPLRFGGRPPVEAGLGARLSNAPYVTPTARPSADDMTPFQREQAPRTATGLRPNDESLLQEIFPDLFPRNDAAPSYPTAPERPDVQGQAANMTEQDAECAFWAQQTRLSDHEQNLLRSGDLNGLRMAHPELAGPLSYNLHVWRKSNQQSRVQSTAISTRPTPQRRGNGAVAGQGAAAIPTSWYGATGGIPSPPALTQPLQAVGSYNPAPLAGPQQTPLLQKVPADRGNQPILSCIRCGTDFKRNGRNDGVRCTKDFNKTNREISYANEKARNAYEMARQYPRPIAPRPSTAAAGTPSCPPMSLQQAGVQGVADGPHAQTDATGRNQQGAGPQVATAAQVTAAAQYPRGRPQRHTGVGILTPATPATPVRSTYAVVAQTNYRFGTGWNYADLATATAIWHYTPGANVLGHNLDYIAGDAANASEAATPLQNGAGAQKRTRDEVDDEADEDVGPTRRRRILIDDDDDDEEAQDGTTSQHGEGAAEENTTVQAAAGNYQINWDDFPLYDDDGTGNDLPELDEEEFENVLKELQ